MEFVDSFAKGSHSGLAGLVAQRNLWAIDREPLSNPEHTAFGLLACRPQPQYVTSKLWIEIVPR